MLYLLILTDMELSYDKYSEDFCIGIFETEQQAKETAEYYIQNIKGFCDFPCTYRIIPKEVKGDIENIKCNMVWIVYGYDINENYDEINIIESQCFITKEQAESELEEFQIKYNRAKWDISFLTIGQKYWQEGFCRMIDGQPIN